MLIYLVGVHSWCELAHLWPSWDFLPTSDKKTGRAMCREQNNSCTEGTENAHNRVTCWNERKSLLCTQGRSSWTQGWAQTVPVAHLAHLQGELCHLCHHSTWAVLTAEGWHQTMSSTLLSPELSPPALPSVSHSFWRELCCSYGNIVPHPSSPCHRGQLSADSLPKERKNHF